MDVIRTEFKARIVDDFKEVMQAHWKAENDVDYSIDSTNGFTEFSEKISGKEVTILKNVYSELGVSYGHDYFEKVDDNWPIPRAAFVIRKTIDCVKCNRLLNCGWCMSDIR